jgi:hypothetical protein
MSSVDLSAPDYVDFSWLQLVSLSKAKTIADLALQRFINEDPKYRFSLGKKALDKVIVCLQIARGNSFLPSIEKECQWAESRLTQIGLIFRQKMSGNLAADTLFWEALCKPVPLLSDADWKLLVDRS